MTAELRYLDVTAHRLIAETALGMAQELYEVLMSSSNVLYKVHQDRADFVRQIAPTLREEARSLLASMLTRNDVSDKEKDKIFDALCMDKMLPKTGTSMVKNGYGP